jgi:hypothetical protein
MPESHYLPVWTSYDLWTLGLLRTVGEFMFSYVCLYRSCVVGGCTLLVVPVDFIPSAGS